jgi:hypothetical protein
MKIVIANGREIKDRKINDRLKLMITDTIIILINKSPIQFIII